MNAQTQANTQALSETQQGIILIARKLVELQNSVATVNANMEALQAHVTEQVTQSQSQVVNQLAMAQEAQALMNTKFDDSISAINSTVTHMDSEMDGHHPDLGEGVSFLSILESEFNSTAPMPGEEVASEVPGTESMEPVAEPVVEPAPAVEPVVETVVEPVAEPVVETVGEPVPVPAVEPIAEPVAEPIA